MPEHVPLNQLAVAVQDAVKRVLAKHGAVPIDQLWVGFVAPDTVANLESANKVAAELGKEAGVRVQGSIGQVGAGVQQEKGAAAKPGHIIGLVFSPKQ
jgi:hypothetical protein